MKKIAVIITTAALILWGLQTSPQSSSLLKEPQKILKKAQVATLRVFKKDTQTALPKNLQEELKKVDALLAELNHIKADYDSKLREYRKLDTAYSNLIVKSRENPNPKLIKEKEGELEAQFQILSSTLKNYQEKSKELYKFQSASLNSNI
ncbi:MAG: hypothetical protein R3A80_11260 [Bdellovibrionota bacterium]